MHELDTKLLYISLLTYLPWTQHRSCPWSLSSSVGHRPPGRCGDQQLGFQSEKQGHHWSPLLAEESLLFWHPLQLAAPQLDELGTTLDLVSEIALWCRWRNTEWRIRRSIIRYSLSHKLDVWPWESQLPSLSFSFLICKLVIILAQHMHYFKYGTVY